MAALNYDPELNVDLITGNPALYVQLPIFCPVFYREFKRTPHTYSGSSGISVW